MSDEPTPYTAAAYTAAVAKALTEQPAHTTAARLLAAELRTIAIDVDVARCRDRGDLAIDLVDIGRRLLALAAALVPPTPGDELDAACVCADAVLAAEDARDVWMSSFADPRPRTRGRAELAHHQAKGAVIVAAERYREARDRNGRTA